MWLVSVCHIVTHCSGDYVNHEAMTAQESSMFCLLSLHARLHAALSTHSLLQPLAVKALWAGLL